MVNILTKDDIAAYAPELDLSAYSDVTISGMISRAQQMAVEYCQVAGFETASVTAEMERSRINADGDLVISPRRFPVQSVSAIRLKGTNVNVNLTLADSAGNAYYFTPYPQNIVYYPSNFLIAAGVGLIGLRAARLFYEIDYVGGFNEPPGSLKEAVSLYLRYFWARSQNAQGVQSFQQGSYSVVFGARKEGKHPLIQEAEGILANGNYTRRVL